MTKKSKNIEIDISRLTDAERKTFFKELKKRMQGKPYKHKSIKN